MLVSTMAIAQFQTVKIGDISKKYQQTLSRQQMVDLVQEIQQRFDAQLGFSVFRYAEDGLPIDILYVSESQKKKRLRQYEKELAAAAAKIDRLGGSLGDEQREITTQQTLINNEAAALNQSIKTLNRTIKANNKKVKSLTKQEYEAIRKTIAKEQQAIEHSTRAFKEKQARYNRDVRSFNRSVNSYNRWIRRYNALVIKMETLSRSIVEVKGKAIGTKTTTIKTYYDQGKKVTEKTRQSDMEKIEIYGFEGDLGQLKAIVAHEIGHLVGVGHVESERALMNPYLQSNQIEKLELTRDDIHAFRLAFGRK